jgi:antirestriction protein ArdC
METATKTSKISERKAALRLICDEVTEMMKSGKIKASNLNDGLLIFYSGKRKNLVWMTLEQWKTTGYSVRKGETAQMIWGKKVENTNEAGEAFSYFPINFVFNNSQVDRSVRNFNSAAAKTETLPQADVASALGPVTGDDLPF